MTTTTRTKNGTEVTLEALESGSVRLTWEHPEHGTCRMVTANFGPVKSGEGAVGEATAKKSGTTRPLGRLCVSIPRADFDAALAEARQMKAAAARSEREAVRSGAIRVSPSYHDGEHLSGHSVHGPAADLLVELGVAKHVAGWGVCVDAAAVRALGESFTYPEAAAYAERECTKAAAARDESVLDRLYDDMMDNPNSIN